MGTPADAWQPDQYRRFQAERDEPFLDLLDLVEQVEGPVVVDLGCGDGRLTAVAHERLGAASTLGIDSSAAMLGDAPSDVDGLRFDVGDIGAWTADATFDVVLANASLHWVPDHAAVLARWRAALRPGGQLAVQLPANADHASDVVLAEATHELGLVAEPDPVAVGEGHDPHPRPQGDRRRRLRPLRRPLSGAPARPDRRAGALRLPVQADPAAGPLRHLTYRVRLPIVGAGPRTGGAGAASSCPRRAPSGCPVVCTST